MGRLLGVPSFTHEPIAHIIARSPPFAKGQNKIFLFLFFVHIVAPMNGSGNGSDQDGDQV